MKRQSMSTIPKSYGAPVEPGIDLWNDTTVDQAECLRGRRGGRVQGFGLPKTALCGIEDRQPCAGSLKQQQDARHAH